MSLLCLLYVHKLNELELVAAVAAPSFKVSFSEMYKYSNLGIVQQTFTAVFMNLRAVR